MTGEERDNLLVRLDVRTEALEKWTSAHTEEHTEHRRYIKRLFLVCLGIAGSALVAACF